MTERYDYLVLGAGSGGLTLAQRAARHGAKVAMFDGNLLGGTCVNLGCVPKKAFWYAAQMAQAQELAAAYGFDGKPGRLDWARFRRLRNEYVAGNRGRYRERLEKAGIGVVRGPARFVAADTVEAEDGTRFSAPQITIATGARPRRLDLPGFDLGWVSDDMFGLDAAPGRVAVVGGGYVAVEFACMLHALGCEVELLLRACMLDSFDGEVVQALHGQMVARGIAITRECDIIGARGEPGRIVLDAANGSVHGPYQGVLWAVGRVPNSDRLGLDTIGVDRDERGFVRVDRWQNTSVPGITAVGDVTAAPALTPVAVEVGYHLVERLFGGQPEAHFEDQPVPTVVFADPPLGCIGLTEAEARARHGGAVRVFHGRFVPMQLALAGRHEATLMKLVCTGDDEQVLGMHALGPGVDEMLQGFAVAMRRGLWRRDLLATLAIHPTSAEEMLVLRG